MNELLQDSDAFSKMCAKVNLSEYKFTDITEPAGGEEPKWAEILKNTLIPEQHKRLNIKPYSASELIKEARVWFDHNEYPDELTKLFIAEHNQADVIEVLDVFADHHCFGETDGVRGQVYSKHTTAFPNSLS